MAFMWNCRQKRNDMHVIIIWLNIIDYWSSCSHKHCHLQVDVCVGIPQNPCLIIIFCFKIATSRGISQFWTNHICISGRDQLSIAENVCHRQVCLPILRRTHTEFLHAQHGWYNMIQPLQVIYPCLSMPRHPNQSAWY